VRFLVDEQLPIALAHWIADRGYVAEHVSEVGLSMQPDHTIVRHAACTRAVIVTKDEDFVASTLRGETVTVVWLRVGNVRNRILLARIEAG